MVTGKTFMFTGTLSITRKTAQARLEAAGGISGASVNQSTDYLVVGERSGSKLFRAQQLGITILTEDEFLELTKQKAIDLTTPLGEFSRQELRDPPPAFWNKVKELDIPVVSESTLVALFIRWEKKKLEKYQPPEEMSYYSRENLSRFLANHDTLPAQESTYCPHCDADILYSISSTNYYCFRCRVFSDGGTKGRHVCWDWEIMDVPLDTGIYKKCKACNSVIFVSNLELVSSEVNRRERNFVHSLEFCDEVRRKYPVVDGPVFSLAEIEENVRTYKREQRKSKIRVFREMLKAQQNTS